VTVVFVGVGLVPAVNVTTVDVGSLMFSVMPDALVEPLKFESPEYCAVIGWAPTFG
jgi:hypothetical protein